MKNGMKIILIVMALSLVGCQAIFPPKVTLAPEVATQAKAHTHASFQLYSYPQFHAIPNSDGDPNCNSFPDTYPGAHAATGGIYWDL
jgi:hypothetical protein